MKSGALSTQPGLFRNRTPGVEAPPSVTLPSTRRCTSCDGTRVELVCSRDELYEQKRYLERFHRRRLRSATTHQEANQLTDRASFTQDAISEIVSCAACGLVSRERQPSPVAAAEEYAADAYGRERLDALFASHVELFTPRITRLRQLIVPAVPRPTVIEVGSFVGGFLSVAETAGWIALGIDPGEEVVAFSREKNLLVRRGTAPEVSMGRGSADVVAIWNTFDQLPDPRPTLAAARRWLRRGGVLALRVPNGYAFRAALGWLHKLPNALRPPLLAAMAWNNLLTFPYLQGYSIETLTHLAGEFGWRPLAVDADTLTRLADEHTAPWAALEERMVKAAWRVVAKADANLAPWIDMYFV